MTGALNIVEVHYGDKTIYRVTEERKNGEIATVGKFQSKDKAQYYINVRQQKDPRHNQWQNRRQRVSRRIKKKDHENLSDTNIQKVIGLLSGTSPISKKEACGILNIAYNTTRLQRIIDEFEETKAYREKRKSQNKGKAATKDEVADAVTRFLSGDTISEIAAGLYRSSGFVKAIIERTGVPQKQEGKCDYLPDECIAEDFAQGEIVWSSHYHGPAIIKQELSIDYQAEKPGIKDVNYEKKYGCKAFNIWVIEKVDDDYSDRWTTATGGGFTATELAYDLGKLTHLEEYGVDLSRI